MKEKLKWIFLYGGLVWGTFCAAIMMIIRGIQEKPMAFGSFPICNDPVKTCSGLNLILWRKFDHEYRDEVRESSLDSQA